MRNCPLFLLLAMAAVPLAAGAAPSIATLLPAATTTAAPAFTLTVNGAGFLAGAAVRLGSQLLPTNVLSSTQLAALVTPAQIAAPGAVMVTVVNPGPEVSHTAPLQVNAPPRLMSAPLARGVLGAVYAQAIAVAGGTPPYLFAYTAGSFPPGLSLAGATGAITGSPVVAGSFDFTLQVTDGAGVVATRAYTLTVTAALAIATSSTLPPGVTGQAYAHSLTATGGAAPYSRWRLASGTLPAGVSLNEATGALAGVPGSTGSFAFAVQVSDANGQTTQAAFTLEIGAGLRIETPSALGDATARTAYSVRLAASGGAPPYNGWRVVAGTVPAAIVLNAVTGELAGVPAAPGAFAFTLAVNDGGGRTASKAFTLTVQPAPLALTTRVLPGGTAGAAYAFTLHADGGTPPYRWTAGAEPLPAGLSLSADGNITGAPLGTGAFRVAIAVQDAAGRSATGAFTLDVAAPRLPPFSLTGLGDTAEPGTQPKLALTLGAAYPVALSGTVALSFTPDAVHLPGGDAMHSPGDAAGDPSLRFANGSRQIGFAIPAGALGAVFDSSPAVQTGTVAGTITLTPSFTANGLALSGAVPLAVRVSRGAPVVRSVVVVRTADGFEVTVRGFATPREVTQASFRFTAATGAALETSEAILPLTQAAADWFTSEDSRAFGGQFAYRQPFALRGDAAAVASVSVTLANSLGESSAAAARVP